MKKTTGKHLGADRSFEELPDPVKTVIYDLAINFGPEFLDEHDRLRTQLQKGSVSGMAHELRNYYKNPERVAGGLKDRRKEEAKVLDDALRSGTLKETF